MQIKTKNTSPAQPLSWQDKMQVELQWEQVCFTTLQYFNFLNQSHSSPRLMILHNIQLSDERYTKQMLNNPANLIPAFLLEQN